MLKIILSGCNGAMGQVIKKLVKDNDVGTIVAGLDKDPKKINNPFPVYCDMRLCKEDADVIIDFSHFSAFDELISFVKKRNLPLVMATTGLTEENEKQLFELSHELPIFRSANMSLGINIMMDAIRRISKALWDSFDIEITEKHHSKKVDSPSGTALMLAQGIDEALNGQTNFVFGRHGKEENRDSKEIGIHAIRGGTIVGEHSVLYAGMDELIEIKHTALSKNIFAIGAIKAAQYITNKENGFYDMEKLLSENK